MPFGKIDLLKIETSLVKIFVLKTTLNIRNDYAWISVLIFQNADSKRLKKYTVLHKWWNKVRPTANTRHADRFLWHTEIMVLSILRTKALGTQNTVPSISEFQVSENRDTCTCYSWAARWAVTTTTTNGEQAYFLGGQ